MLGPNKPNCDNLKLSTHFRFKMAAKTANFIISLV